MFIFLINALIKPDGIQRRNATIRPPRHFLRSGPLKLITKNSRTVGAPYHQWGPPSLDAAATPSLRHWNYASVIRCTESWPRFEWRAWVWRSADRLQRQLGPTWTDAVLGHPRRRRRYRHVPSHHAGQATLPTYLLTHTQVNSASRSTQPCIPPGSLNRVPASAEVRAGMSPLSGGR